MSTDLRITEQDRHDAARITALWTAKHKRDRKTCMAIGREVYQHLERKNLPRGETNRYARAVFNRAWHSLQRCQKLFIMEPELADADELAEQHPEWINPYEYEPDKSLNLLKWAAEKRLESGPTLQGLEPIIAPETDWLSVLVGDCRVKLCGLPEKLFQACIFSPPYHGLREYSGLEAEIGLEPKVEDWVFTLVRDVCREIKRKMRDDGVMCIIIGDRVARRKQEAESPKHGWCKDKRPATHGDDLAHGNLKDLPGRLARALQNDGWMWRSEIIWEKSGHTSHGDKRPQPVHDKVLLFSKSMRYYYNQDAVREAAVIATRPGPRRRQHGATWRQEDLKDLGTVWRIPQHTGKHDGMVPSPLELVRRLMLCTTKEGDCVLDPFMGTGTTGVVSKLLHRKFTGIELNPAFAENAIRRIQQTDQPPVSWNSPVVASEVDLLKEQLAHVTLQRDALDGLLRWLMGGILDGSLTLLHPTPRKTISDRRPRQT
jgi:site-specific DNA-methyltransferase (cytosine-N4-specific)